MAISAILFRFVLIGIGRASRGQGLLTDETVELFSPVTGRPAGCVASSEARHSPRGPRRGGGARTVARSAARSGVQGPAQPFLLSSPCQ